MVSYAARRSRLIQAFPASIDGFLVTRPVNVRYLCGFTGSSGSLLLAPDGPPVVATDGRYLAQIEVEAPDLECIETRTPAAALVDEAARNGVTRLGVESRHVTLDLFESLRAAADGRLELVATPPLVEPHRVTKDADELDLIRQACVIADAAYDEVLAGLRPGVTERAVARQLESGMRERGADAVAFDSIVAFGANSAIPHHQPTDRELAAGDLVKVDFGALVAGYRSDMTRTVAVLPVADWQRELHATVTSIQAECRAACRPGAVPAELDAAAVRAVEAAGHHVAHGLGHGVGLEIHEDPFLTPGSSAAPLAENMVVTIEPGIYLPSLGGVRIEDTMRLDRDGATALTGSGRELVEVG